MISSRYIAVISASIVLLTTGCLEDDGDLNTIPEEFQELPDASVETAPVLTNNIPSRDLQKLPVPGTYSRVQPELNAKLLLPSRPGMAMPQNYSPITTGFQVYSLADKPLIPGKAQTLLYSLGGLQGAYKASLNLPEGWSEITSQQDLEFLAGNESLFFTSVIAPVNTKPGIYKLGIVLENDRGNQSTQSQSIIIQETPGLSLDILQGYSGLDEGQMGHMVFLVQNTGNTPLDIILKSNGDLDIPEAHNLLAGQQLEVPVRFGVGMYGTVFLEAHELKSGKHYRKSERLPFFPSIIPGRDPYHRLPLQARLIYSGQSRPGRDLENLSLELSGGGYLDQYKHHFLDVLLRSGGGINTTFGPVDQYSLTYRFKDIHELLLGDQNPPTDRLGFQGKYGFGFQYRLGNRKQSVTAFYSKPRFRGRNQEPVYGIRTDWMPFNWLEAGVSFSRSSRDRLENELQKPEKGQIAGIRLKLNGKNLSLESESSLSTSTDGAGAAQFLQLRSSYRRYFFNSSFTLAGKDYFGTLSNSQQFANILAYRGPTWNWQLGQLSSKVNQRLNPLFYATEPHLKNYYARLQWRPLQQHQFRLRADRREREDRLEPVSYHYREWGLSGNYTFITPQFSAGYTAQFNKTLNLLREDSNYRTNFTHRVQLGIQVTDWNKIWLNVQQFNQARYAERIDRRATYRYSLGTQLRIGRKFRANLLYNNRFSPEEQYLQRDYVSLNVTYRPRAHHQFDIRGNFFERPGVESSREMWWSASYAYRFGLPLRKTSQQGGVSGLFHHSQIPLGDIQFRLDGRNMVTDAGGQFKVSDLAPGWHSIDIDTGELPEGLILKGANPYPFKIADGKETSLSLEFLKSSSLSGIVATPGTEVHSPMEDVKLRLEGEGRIIAVRPNFEGKFHLPYLAPGNYTLTVVNLPTPWLSRRKEQQIVLAPGEGKQITFTIYQKENKIRMLPGVMKIAGNGSQ